MPSASIAVLSVVLLICGCTAKNPAFCESDADCNSTGMSFCDVDGVFGDRNACVAEPPSPDAASSSVDAAAVTDAAPLDACIPSTCESLGALCGPSSDGCSGSLDCGRCFAEAKDGDFVRIWRRESGGYVEVFGGIAGRSADDVAWADVDDDGDLDVVFSGGSDPSGVIRNDGATFTLAWESEPGFGVGVSLGDADGDGDLDWAVASGGGVRVYRNDGGSFSTPLFLDTGSVSDVTLADLDGDDLADLAVSDFGGATRVYRNLAGADFELLWSSEETTNSVAIVAADFDGDGARDLAVANCALPATEGTQVYRNNAAGSFELTFTSTQTDCASDIAWAESGSLRRLVVAYEIARVRFFRHVGTGVFAFFDSGPGGDVPDVVVFGVSVTDLDADGDFDYAIATEERDVQVFERTAKDFSLVFGEENTGLTRSVAWSE